MVETIKCFWVLFLGFVFFFIYILLEQRTKSGKPWVSLDTFVLSLNYFLKTFSVMKDRWGKYIVLNVSLSKFPSAAITLSILLKNQIICNLIITNSFLLWSTIHSLLKKILQAHDFLMFVILVLLSNTS